MNIFSTIPTVGVAVILTVAPALAWERTTETKIATDGTPLVQLVAESGDLLGTPWLAYLTSIGYDVSGDWWTATAQTLLDYNPGATFVPTTNYGIMTGSVWWLPDSQALQTATPVESAASPVLDPVIRQSEFVALAEAWSEDIAATQAYQQQSEDRLNARLDTVEAVLSAAESDRNAMSEDILLNQRNLTATQNTMNGVVTQVVDLESSTQAALEGVANKVDELQNVIDSVESNLTLVTNSVASERNWFTAAFGLMALSILLGGAYLLLNTKRKVKGIDQSIAGLSTQFEGELDQVATVAAEAKELAIIADKKASLVMTILLDDYVLQAEAMPSDAQLKTLQLEGGSIDLHLSHVGCDCKLIIEPHGDGFNILGLGSRNSVHVKDAKGIVRTIGRALRRALHDEDFPRHFPGVGRKATQLQMIAAA